MKNNIVAVLNRHETGPYNQLLTEREWPNANISFDPADIPQANILFGEPDLIIPHFPAAKKLVWLQSTWAGVEPFLKPNVKKDYTLTNARGIFGRTIAEYALTYILAHERHLLAHAQRQHTQVWEPVLPGRLHNKTLGIIGVGSIGTVVAQLFKGLGLTVLGYTRSSQHSAAVDRYFHPPTGLTKMAAVCDYMLNVMPSTPASTDLLNAAIFKAMRPTALLINAGRGTAIVDDDLIVALNDGEIAGAVLDVFRQEPLAAEHPFWTTPNCLITPHTAAPSYPEDVLPIFHDNYLRFVEGRPLKYVVDFEKGY